MVKRGFLVFTSFAVSFASLWAQELSKSLVLKNNDLAFKAFDVFYASCKTGNLVFSPTSVYESLAALYLAADGQTALEIRTAMKFPAKEEMLIEELNSLNAAFKKHTTANAQIFTQMSLCVEDDIVLAPTIKTDMEKTKAIVQSVNFENARASMDIVNKTINQYAKYLVPAYFEVGQMRSADLFIFQSLAYFDGNWKHFSTSKKDTRIFNVNKDTKIEVPVLNSEGKDFNYLMTDDFYAFKLPYAGDTLSLIIILPETSVQSALATLKPSLFLQMLKKLSATDCQTSAISLPSFRLNSSAYSLLPLLKTFGVKTAFSDNADFSKISADLKGKALSNFYNKTVFNLAAKTKKADPVETKHGMFGIPLRTNNIDRPFAFFVVDNATNLICFMGCVSDPSQK